MLQLKETDSTLEPCGGDGVFVDELLNINENANISIFELNPEAVDILKAKYKKYQNISIKHTDTLLDSEVVEAHIKYDKIIGNPPYGARNSEQKKEELGKIYPGLYIKESYTLFLYACLRCLRDGGMLSFIIPDTFLTLHRHVEIRRFILLNTKIKEIALFPSSFFPGVNFGYSNLCIITLQRSDDELSNIHNSFTIRTGFKKVTDLDNYEASKNKTYTQQDIISNHSLAFYFNSSERIDELINDPFIMKIGDIADCVTGFYSGNDKKYLHPLTAEQKNAKRYEVADATNICQREIRANEKTEGIRDKTYLVPIVKGGNKQYVKPNEWFMNWSEKAIKEYRGSKKCRFQNSTFYFREGGVAVPMVRSSILTAALIENRLFDQSIVGIFPRNLSYTLYLLAFFNSNVATKLISAINPTTNNSANYIKKIPFLIPSDELRGVITDYSKRICDSLKSGDDDIEYYRDQINVLLEDLYQLHEPLKATTV